MLNSDRRRTVLPHRHPQRRDCDGVRSWRGVPFSTAPGGHDQTIPSRNYLGWSSRWITAAVLSSASCSAIRVGAVAHYGLDVAGRVIRLGWFTSLPAGLLTAICADRDRVDLLVVPPDTDPGVADAAMALAADPTNTLRTPDIVPTAASRLATRTEAEARNGWESEGGRLRTLERPPAS